ncbi:helix-turn-helix domain-containing protein [Cereibacter sphaeroides]|nr:helix-turn-helix domain-containing protein [Cereibacter sphaeroides]QCP84405.1 helix-turn-helix domain-containing protein [Cereibacter sphaeroides]
MAFANCCQAATAKLQMPNGTGKVRQMEMSPFATRLSALLDERNMTRADLARAAGIPYHRLNPWFSRPKAKPMGADLHAVARVMGVSEDFLLRGGERRPYSALDSLLRRAATLDPKGQEDLATYLEFLLARQEAARNDQD